MIINFAEFFANAQEYLCGVITDDSKVLDLNWMHLEETEANAYTKAVSFDGHEGIGLYSRLVESDVDTLLLFCYKSGTDIKAIRMIPMMSSCKMDLLDIVIMCNTRRENADDLYYDLTKDINENTKKINNGELVCEPGYYTDENGKTIPVIDVIYTYDDIDGESYYTLFSFFEDGVDVRI